METRLIWSCKFDGFLEMNWVDGLSGGGRLIAAGCYLCYLLISAIVVYKDTLGASNHSETYLNILYLISLIIAMFLVAVVELMVLRHRSTCR